MVLLEARYDAMRCSVDCRVESSESREYGVGWWFVGGALEGGDGIGSVLQIIKRGGRGRKGGRRKRFGRQARGAVRFD